MLSSHCTVPACAAPQRRAAFGSARAPRTIARAAREAPVSQIADPWERAQDMMLRGTVAEGTITGYNKGGVLVELGDLKGFMPYTKIAPERLRAGHKGDLSYLMGKKVKARIVQVDKDGARKELVLSERQAALTEAVRQYKPGQVVRGQVLRLEDYGALLAIYNAAGRPSGVQGLLHKSELSWDLVMTVDDVIAAGQELDVKVVSVDVPRCRVGLSLKQMQKDPLRETMDSIQWRETAAPLPEVEQIIQVLELTSGIEKVTVGRQAEEAHIVAQDVELYLTKQSRENGFALVARVGRMLQELLVDTTLSKDDMKKALTRVLSRAPRPAAGAQRAAAGAPGAAAPAEQPEMHSRARRWCLVGFWPDVRVDPSVWGIGHAATVMQFTVRGATLRLLQLRCAREVTPAGGWTPGVGCVPGLWRAGYGQACPASAIARREAGQKRSWAVRQRAETPDPEPGLPAWQKVSPPRRHVMERVGPAAAAAAAARREEHEQRREQQLERRRTLVQEPAANDLVDPLTGATAPPRAGERAEPPAWAACYARAQQARMPRALRHFGWSLLHGGVRVSGDRVFSYQRAAPELAELACPHPLCRAQQQPPLETLGHVLGGCPVAAAVLQWVMLADDFARSGVAPELQQLWTHLRLLLLRALLAARARHGGGQPGHAPVAAIRIFVYSVRDAVVLDWRKAAMDVRALAGVPRSWLSGSGKELTRAGFERRWCHRGVIARTGQHGGRFTMEFRLAAAGVPALPAAPALAPPAAQDPAAAAAAAAPEANAQRAPKETRRGATLVQAFNYHYLNQAAGAPQLAATQRLGLVTLIHKGGQPREAVSSYRPITLLNADTKIAAKAIVQRLAPALGSIVDGTQTAFVPGRDIADNVLMHLEAIDHARETRAPGCLLFLDFAKAYDRLDRGWLFRCLARMGLPDATTRWVRLLLAGTRARVAFNGGHVSREFSVASGCAQGSPLSPLLYVLAAQPLAAMCRRVQRQPGFASLQLPGGAGPAPCCHQHADDTTLHAASVESAKRLLDGAVAPFCLASGAQLNLAKCKGMLLGDHPALQLQPDGSGQLVECSTGVCFPDTEQAPVRHLGVLLSATGVERHAAQLYRERLRTITCRIAHWSRYALTRPGRRHVARQVLAACVGWHAQFVPVPADLLRLIQRRVTTAYIVGNWCIRASDNRIIRQVPRAAIACLPASMGGEAQVDVAAFTTAMLAKTAARLLHPVGAAWKPPAAARFARALPGRGTAALVQGTALELRAQLPWRWGAIACAFAALGVHRVIPHGSMTVEQIRVEALVGNCSVGAALGGARIASLEDLPAELRSDSLGQAAPRLPWRPAADGVVMPGEWQQALARSGPSAPGWQALRPSAAPPSPGGGVVQQPQQPLAALPVEQPPQPPPPPPAVRWVRRWALGAAAASFFEVGPDSRLRTAEPPPEIVAAGGWEDCCVVDAAQAPRPAAGAQRAAAGAPGAAAPAEQPEMHSRARRWCLVGFWPDVRVDPSVWGLGHAATVMQFTVRGATLRLLQLRCAREVTPAGGWTPGVGCVPGLWRAGYGQACPASAIARREAGQKRSWAERQRAETPDPEPGLPAWQKVSPPRRHVMERVGPAAAAAAAARREEHEQRREQQLQQRRTLVQEPAANDLVDPLTAGAHAARPATLWLASVLVWSPIVTKKKKGHFGWSLLHGGVRVSGDRVFSYQRAAPELAELACPHPLCRAQQQPPLETLGHVLGGCPVAAAVLQWFAHLWARLQPGFPRAPPPPRVMLADDFARSGVAPELQQLWTHLRLLLLRALLAARARHGGGQPGHAPVAAIRIFVYSVRDAVVLDWRKAAMDVRALAGVPRSWLSGSGKELTRADFERRWCHRGVIARTGQHGGRFTMEFRLTAAGVPALPAAPALAPPAAQDPAAAAAAAAAAQRGG
ncbi:transposon TX1 protein [Scenedesmus sp. PABB004]|nr:transposon TX1 protein [Scenedesmus sp. PABB004]